MDPLTHTLVGASLASTRLGEKTPLATAALVIGANAPDIDVFAYALDGDFAIGFRRGWTHGILALVVLPFILTGVLLLFDRFVRRKPDAPASVHWLVPLSVIAILTHPFLDWLNNYGMRWLMPFDGTWFYGDSVFIMDPWLWLILGCGWLLGRPPSALLLSTWAVFSGLLLFVVAGRSSRYVPVVATVAIAWLLALLWRKGSDTPLMRGRLAAAGLTAALVFIGGTLGIHGMTVTRVERDLADLGIGPVERLMVGPVPIDPSTWSVVAQLPAEYRFGTYAWRSGGFTMEEARLPVPKPSPLWDTVKEDPSVRGFMTWARFPRYEVERTPNGTKVHIMDVRYTRGRTTGFGGVEVAVEAE